MLKTRYGRLKVLKRTKTKQYERQTVTYVKCLCDCGTKKYIRRDHLMQGHTLSCGCLHKELSAAVHTTHGDSKTKEYRTWFRMLQRCYNKNVANYGKYGGRGISVCKRWRNSYKNFISDMGKCPNTKWSINRIDNDGNYTPENCEWASDTKQANNKSNNVRISYGGKTKTVSQWARELNMPQATLYQRLFNFGYSVAEAFGTKIRKCVRKGDDFTVNGKTQGLKAWAEELGIPYKTLWARVYNFNWDLDRAFTVPVKAHATQRKGYTFKGRTQSLAAWAEELGIGIKTLQARIYDKKMSVEDALAMPLDKKHSFSAKK